jgi:hypothetical protein
MDIGTKRNLISISKWVGFWTIYAIIDIFVVENLTGSTLLEKVIDTPAYLCAFIWASLAIWLGEFEGRFFHYKNQNDKNNEHFLFVLIRACTLIPIYMLTEWKSALCIAAIFPFFHDGSYYTQRNKMDRFVYPKKWWAQSTTSTALTTRIFTPIVRTILAVVGLVTLIIINK